MSIPYGIYVHAPWCSHKCPYCAFNVYVEPNPPFIQWRDGVLRDWGMQSPYFSGKALSLYFGGGTPSLVPIEVLSSVILRLPLHPSAEITLEVNPENISVKNLALWKSIGINRLSVGVQTFNPLHAKRLARGNETHRLEAILAAVHAAGFRSWSFDLMFGLPNQSVLDVDEELAQLIAIRPPHVSLYGLTYEEGTPFDKRRKKGLLKPISERTWSEQYGQIRTFLKNHGYIHYEISNFAQPEHRSIHNESIWKNGFYAGLGPGAHGYLPNGQRTVMSSTWESWQGPNSFHIETPSPEAAMIDAVLTWIRHADGIPLDDISEMGWRIQQDTILELSDTGFIWQKNRHLGLTDKGLPIADSVTLRIIDAISPAKARV